MQMTAHFSFEELTASQKAATLHLNNAPNEQHMKNLQILANGLEQVRALLNAPMSISSGYRSPALNSAVGGVSNSAHLDGFAADFTAPQFGTPLEIVEFLSKSTIQFDQIIQEGTWVHISFAPTMRREVLTAHFRTGEKTSYSEGV